MLVLSAGMQKSGSGYFYNIINDLLSSSARGVDTRQVRAQHNLDWMMDFRNNNIGTPTVGSFLRLWRLTLKHGTFVVKTHEASPRGVRMMSRLGKMRIVYCYRDPRDAMLSAIDHGNSILAEGENHTFAEIVKFEDALRRVESWVSIYEKYANMPGVLTVRYEDAMFDPVAVFKKIENFLGIIIDPEKRQEIIWLYSKDNQNGERRGLHFNNPKPLRYKTEMTKEQQSLCNDVLGYYLKKMGYSIE